MRRKIFSLRMLIGKTQRPSKFWIVPDGPNLKLKYFVQLGFSSKYSNGQQKFSDSWSFFELADKKTSGFPKWSWHVLSQITTDLFSIQKFKFYKIIKMSKLKVSFYKSWWWIKTKYLGRIGSGICKFLSQKFKINLIFWKISPGANVLWQIPQ